MTKKHIATLLALSFLTAGIHAKTLVTVNGSAIDSSVIDAQVSALRAANPQIQDSAELRQSLLERTVVDTVVSQEAKRLKLNQTPEFKKALENARAEAKKQGADKKPTFKAEWADFENNLNGQAYSLHIARQNPVQEKDIKAAYDDFSNFYKGTQEIQLGEIMTKDAADAKKAADALDAKKSFAEVLKTYSVNEAAKQSGGISPEYVSVKDLQQSMPPLYEAVKDLKKGAHTAPMSSGNTHGIFYVNDRRDFQVPSYDELKNNIGNSLQAERIDNAVQELLRKSSIKPAQ